jgi:hypothetical protein
MKMQEYLRGRREREKERDKGKGKGMRISRYLERRGRGRWTKKKP